MVMSVGSGALGTMLLLAMPLLLTALVIGLLVGVFQAATQINEMTLSFIPKLVGMTVTIVVAGPWMLKVIVSYTRELFESIPALIR
jgi:flagellar biosynthetic protein FliQ